MNKFLCIHGHFYQPPRENPWIEEIEKQDSAAPCHDWNERILRECYEPNCYARIVDGSGRIIEIVNNYELMSFNFGPTLFSWMEKKAKAVYASILEADRLSVRRLKHGNAIAQAYNHMILPLANDHDRETQIIWGIEDFRYRFNRDPEGMWLPETAVNGATIAALIAQKIQFIILAPAQAQRVRPLAGGEWTEVAGGVIDTTRPYRCFLKNPDGSRVDSNHIDIFFYDGAMSAEISFGNYLADGKRFADLLNQAYSREKEAAQLIHVATDGETYGHHKKFGEMALAYALSAAVKEHGFQLTNYGAFLEQFPPEFEVELNTGPADKGTAWSCAHGVGRWQDDCGCRIDWQGSWNQKWRRPLRDALNILRDRLAELFELEGSNYFTDPWDARNEYISMLVDRSFECRERFFGLNACRDLKTEDQVRALRLLEMQRNAQFMFTSCGWFFDDISGLEATQILKYADRALQLAETFTGHDIANPFLEKLSLAHSNIAGFGTGRDIYYRVIRPCRISMEQVLNQFAILSSLEEVPEKIRRIYDYTVKVLEYERREHGKSFLITARIRMTSETTTESKEFFYALAYLGSYYFRCVIGQVVTGVDYNPAKDELQACFDENPETIVQKLTGMFGEHYFTLRDTLQEERQMILQTLIKNRLEAYDETIARVYDENRETIEGVIKEGLSVPPEFKAAAEHTLGRRMERELEVFGERFDELKARGVLKKIVLEAREYGYSLKTERIKLLLRGILRVKIERLRIDCNEQEIIGLQRLLEFSAELDVQVSTNEAQNSLYVLLKTRLPELSERAKAGNDAARCTTRALIQLADKMNFSTEQFNSLFA
jgi:alpha-amylase/alpha-mannosidase (GH57 family)